MVLVAFVASLASAVGVVFIATVDVVYLIRGIARYAGRGRLDTARAHLRSNAIGQIVTSWTPTCWPHPDHLRAGPDELFIRRIDVAEVRIRRPFAA